MKLTLRKYNYGGIYFQQSYRSSNSSAYFMNLLKVQELKLFIVVLKNLGEFPRRYLQNCCSLPEKPFLSTNWQDCWKFPSEEGEIERFFQSFSHHGKAITEVYKDSSTAQKTKFSMKHFFSKCDQIRHFPANLVTFTAEIFNIKIHFLCGDALIAGIAKYKIKFIPFINPFLAKHPKIFGPPPPKFEIFEKKGG